MDISLDRCKLCSVVQVPHTGVSRIMERRGESSDFFAQGVSTFIAFALGRSSWWGEVVRMGSG